MLKEHVETLHGIVRLIIVRVASFRRPLGIFSSAAFVSAIEVVSATRSMVYITGRSRAFIPFMCRVIMCVAKIIVETVGRVVDRVCGGGSVVAWRWAAHPLGDRGGLCVAQHGLYNWEKPGLYSFLCSV